ncbi:MAG: efflux RND transporter periplasmic adaptor subunit, partial [Gammaproteobacteria bacterium]|nr:efflux RND transporter periplasmic adaptor subunit [Gammaproteobacteria bacterium]
PGAPALGAGELAGYDCLIEARTVVELSTREIGTIEELLVGRGDLVEAGQAVARLESALEQASVALARSRADMRAVLQEREENLEFAKREHARSEELYAKRSVPFQELDRAATGARIAELQLRQAQHEQQTVRLELRRAETALAARTIKSPIDGVVVERLLAVGESVEDRPIIRLAEVDPLKVEVIVPVEDFGRIEAGMRARVEPVIPGGEARIATVKVVDRVVDAASGTFGVELELPNPDYRLPGGLKCEIRFMDGGS